MAAAPESKRAKNRWVVENSALDDNSVICMHENTMSLLDIFAGDSVIVRGNKKKETVLFSVSDPTCEEGRVRLNGCSRKNLAVQLGDVVGIHKAGAIPYGSKVCIIPFADSIEGVTGDIFEVFLKPYFSQAYRPVKKGDTFIARGNMRAVEFKVVGVEVPPPAPSAGEAGAVAKPPTDCCTVCPDTQIVCDYKPGEALERPQDDDMQNIGDIRGCGKAPTLIRENFATRASGSTPDLARFLSTQASPSEFIVLACSSANIDGGGRGCDRGARIFLPPSLLHIILKKQDLGLAPAGEVMLFEVKNKDAVVHVGVQEFIAPEGVCGIPSWMWNQLGIAAEKQRVTVTQVPLPNGGFVKFKPLQAEFLQTHNPKAILEKNLRGFAALTMGMVITIFYGDLPKQKRFDLEVVELRDDSGQKLRKGQGVCICIHSYTHVFVIGFSVSATAAEVDEEIGSAVAGTKARGLLMLCHDTATFCQGSSLLETPEDFTGTCWNRSGSSSSCGEVPADALPSRQLLKARRRCAAHGPAALGLTQATADSAAMMAASLVDVPVISYFDHYLSRTMRVPAKYAKEFLHHHFKFVRLLCKLPCAALCIRGQRSHQIPPLLLHCMQLQQPHSHSAPCPPRLLPPPETAGRQCFLHGCVLAAGHALTTPPVGVRVLMKTRRRWIDRIFVHVMYAFASKAEQTQAAILAAATARARFGHIHFAAENGDVATVLAHLIVDRSRLSERVSGDFCLHRSAMYGHVETTELLLSSNADVNARDQSNQTPLHLCALYGHTETTELLLSHRADVNARCKDETTPLHHCAEYGHVDATAVLLGFNADVNAKDRDYNTPLHLSAAQGRVTYYATEVLLTSNADVNARNKQNRTPLHYSALCGHEEATQLLLTFSADVNAIDESCLTPLHWSASMGHLEVCCALVLAKADAAATDLDGRTPLECAIEDNQTDVIAFLCSTGDFS